ncbi:MAG: dihydrodipicolinate synthase family protein [Chloroflexi bacterium GWC2_73_18]|nr:MAG: dihydrodipicolinate synthase family protein [Chloroflexi bacterium GWC2_73_18]
MLTPLTADLAPDDVALVRLARWLLANGCDGLGVLGTTGEANSFSVEERLAITEALVAGGLPMERIIIGTGCCAVPDTVRLTRRALEVGAGGVLVLPPFYYKGVSDDGLFAAFAETIERVGDSSLRLYLYHFPRMSGIDLPLPLIERLLAAYPHVVAGTKDSGGDLARIEATCRAFPGFAVFAGTERYLLAALRAGGAGCISATINVTGRPAAGLVARWRSPEAETLQAHLTELRATIEAFPLVAAVKEIMARHTGEDGWRAVRPPLVALPPDQADALVARLEALGGLDLAPLP